MAYAIRPCAYCGNEIVVECWAQNRIKYHAECYRHAERERARDRLLARRGRAVASHVGRASHPPDWDIY